MTENRLFLYFSRETRASHHKKSASLLSWSVASLLTCIQNPSPTCCVAALICFNGRHKNKKMCTDTDTGQTQHVYPGRGTVTVDHKWQVQVIPFMSVTSYISWSSSAPELHAFFDHWRAHLQISLLLSRSSTESETARIHINRPGMTQTLCRRSSPVTRAVSTATTQRPNSSTTKIMPVVFLDICLCCLKLNFSRTCVINTVIVQSAEWGSFITSEWVIFPETRLF